MVEEGRSVWAWRGESRRAEMKTRPPMRCRRYMLAMVDEVDARNLVGIEVMGYVECPGWRSHGRWSDEIIDQRALHRLVMKQIEGERCS